jgi:two-component system sensor histidine kinase DesK
MVSQTHSRHGIHRWISADNPMIWLVYLPFFFVPWYFSLPSTPQMIGAVAGVLVFLGIYVAGIGMQGVRLVVLATVALLLSFGLAFTNSNWIVIAVYAAAMICELRPRRQAVFGLGLFSFATVAVSLGLQQQIFFWAPGVLMMVMVGASVVSRSALEDKNRALATAQDEVRQMAAVAERERIGRDLHDLLGRTLTLIAIKAELAAKLSSRDAARAEAEMREVSGAAREALAEVRAAVAGMTGASLARELASARSALGAAGIGCEIEGDADQVERGDGAVLAMTLREAITNVIRHSRARSCRIGLTRDAGTLELTVRDDGDGAGLREGGGLGGVRSRLAAAGGVLIVSGDAAGTCLVARLPTGQAS